MQTDIEDSTPSHRLLCKVIVVGVDPALQAGFIAKASSMSKSNYMLTPLRFALGVAVVRFPGFTVTNSLWSFSLTDKCAYETYAKGYRAAAIVIQVTQIKEIPRILQLLKNPDLKRIVVTLVYDNGPEQKVVEAQFNELGIQVQVQLNSTIIDVLQQATLRAISEQDSTTTIPVMCVSAKECPPLVECVASSCSQEVQMCIDNAVDSIKTSVSIPIIHKTNEGGRIALSGEPINADLRTDVVSEK